MEGPEETKATAQQRLVKCMMEPFMKDRPQLHHLMGTLGSRTALSEAELAAWDGCYHCGMRLPLTVDSDVATTWYDAK